MATCQSCSKEFEGRSNKKFCSNECKNKHHNAAHREKQEVITDINKILHRNWTTLHHLYGIYRSAPISMNIVEAYGFNKKYFTHVQNSPIGEKYTMAYDVGFKNHIDNQIQIVVTDF